MMTEIPMSSSEENKIKEKQRKPEDKSEATPAG